jgi:PAS domain S-box-containing protein
MKIEKTRKVIPPEENGEDSGNGQPGNGHNLLTPAETSQDATIATDKELNITNWNKAAETLFGWRATEVLGKQASPEIRSGVLDFLTHPEIMQAITENGSWRGKVFGSKKDGSKSVTLVSIEVIWDNDGGFNGLVSSHREIGQSTETREVLLPDEIKPKIKRAAEALEKPLDLRIEPEIESKPKDNRALSDSDFSKIRSAIKELTAVLEAQIKYYDKHFREMENLTHNIQQLDATIKKELEVGLIHPLCDLKKL